MTTSSLSPPFDAETAVRKAREQARAELAEAQRDLTRMLTPTQQAVMVGLGYLE